MWYVSTLDHSDGSLRGCLSLALINCHIFMSKLKLLTTLPHEEWQDVLKPVRDLTASVSRHISQASAGTTVSADIAASSAPRTADVSQNTVCSTSHAYSFQEQSTVRLYASTV